MNIIKFKDKKIEEDTLYNETFRNKYCYAIRWTYVIPLEGISIDAVRLIEKDGEMPDGTPSIELEEYINEIDWIVTDQINNTDRYIAYNQFTPDSEITIDELKKFRWWLAYTILNICEHTDLLDDKTKDMLWYYRKNMYDNTIKHLNNFQAPSQQITYSEHTCSCTQHINNINGITNACDPIAIYRRGVYNYMVEVFGSLDFWKEFESAFLIEFKKYIDGIITHNFKLYESDYISDYVDCGCISNADTAQQLLMRILKNLSDALDYMIKGEIESHKNAISKAFLEWATKLYEKMYWA